MRKFNFYLHENVKNFTLIPNFTFFFFLDDPKKSYVVKLNAIQQKYGKWGKIGQYVFFKINDFYWLKLNFFFIQLLPVVFDHTKQTKSFN